MDGGPSEGAVVLPGSGGGVRGGGPSGTAGVLAALPPSGGGVSGGGPGGVTEELLILPASGGAGGGGGAANSGATPQS